MNDWVFHLFCFLLFSSHLYTDACVLPDNNFIIATLASVTYSTGPIMPAVFPNTHIVVWVSSSIVRLLFPPSPMILPLSLIKSFGFLAYSDSNISSNP